jgi:predicted AAA+ superfamily ATPase
MIAMMDTKTKGDIAETFVLANLIKQGFTVSIPYGENSRYDLIIETKSGFKRIQIKYVSKRKNKNYHTLPLRSVRSNRTRNKIVHYTDKDIDYIIGYCPDNNSCYVIPMKGLKIKHELHIWVNKKPKGKNQFKPLDVDQYKNNWRLLK